MPPDLSILNKSYISEQILLFEQFQLPFVELYNQGLLLS